MELKVVRGDITRLEVEVIVNAANASLLGGGGVDGAIHKAAGPELLTACEALGGCETGDVKVTPGFRLPARWVFNAVGPVWGGGGEEELLARCYRRSMELAVELGVGTIAFPAISTGVYQFPRDRAVAIAVSTVRNMGEGGGVERVVFCAFEQAHRGDLPGAAARDRVRDKWNRPVTMAYRPRMMRGW